MPEPPIETLYTAMCELIGFINLANDRTHRDVLTRWAKELARITSEIDLRLKAGEAAPRAWDIRTRVSAQRLPAGGT